MAELIKMNALKIVVHGRVQKVGYRNFIFEKAIELSIKGKVENRQDGTVYIEAVGSNMQLDEFLEWCYKGSIMAKVSKINVSPSNDFTYSDFKINRNTNL
jgi:acylphosphatase